jgi:hypothetical protein
MNLNIVFSKFRISPDDFKKILEDLDDEKISLEEISKILDNAPNEEEIKKLREFPGDPNLISSGEKYCFIIATVNRAMVILDAMKFKKKIVGDAKDLINKFSMVIDAYLSIKDSKSFEDVLKMILAIGNYLNTGMAKGNANGINLNVLSILSEMKSNTKEKYSLMEVLVLIIRTKEQRLMGFYKDFTEFEQILNVRISLFIYGFIYLYLFYIYFFNIFFIYFLFVLYFFIFIFIFIKLDIPEIEIQIKDIENKVKKVKMTRENFEKLNDPNLKKILDYFKSLELNSSKFLDEIIEMQDKYKKETKIFLSYFGEEEKNFKLPDFFKGMSDFVKSFKVACL